MQVRVHAEVLDILTGSRNTTNYFYFVFDSNNPNMPQVIPRTYAGNKCYFLLNALCRTLLYVFFYVFIIRTKSCVWL